jgi:pimeloyl-ACP methyl ester carboxylesterase
VTGSVPLWPGELVTTGSRSLFVRRAAPTAPGAEAAVLVHGLGGSSTNWTDTMGLLRDRLDCHAPDLPGFGRSPVPADRDYGLEAHAAAVVDLIGSVADGPVHLLGNSLGGTVAVVAAARRPDLVRTLTLVSPALPVRRPRLSNVHLPLASVPGLGRRLAAGLARLPVERRVRMAIALCFADPSRVPPDRFEAAVAEATRRAGLPHSDDAMLASLRRLLLAYLRRGDGSLWATAGRVTAPTLLVYGQRDRLVAPATGTRAARTFPRARLVLLPDSGHVSQMEHPEVVAREVRRLLDRTRTRTPSRG